MEAIRFAISIPSYKPTEYYNKLVEYTARFYSDSDMMELLYKLASTTYEFRQ